MATVIVEATDSGIGTTTMVARDADGNETLRIDQNSDGLVDSIIERRFGAGGRLAQESRDLNLDGTPDWTRTLTYDSAGLLAMVRTVADVDADGDLDSIRETLHDSRGNPATSNIDNDGDGDIDQVDSWTYDSEGRLLLHTSSNPVTDRTLIVQKLEYDDAGRVTYRESTSVFVYSWTYDDNGILRESVITCVRCFNTSVTTTHYNYDAVQRRTTLDTQTWYSNGTYSDRSLIIYEYDETGTLRRQLTDEDADGSYELRVEYVNQPGDWSSMLDTRIDQPPSFTLPSYYED
jgi:serralysin